MSNNRLLLNISSKYIIKLLFSHLQLNMFYKIIKYNKNFQKKIDINLEDSLKNYLYNIEKKEVIFLIRYKGFKINNFPLPSCFESMNLENKIIILEINKYNYKYSLNNKHIELIYLINEFIEKNNMDKLICNKNEKLHDFFKAKYSNNNN